MPNSLILEVQVTLGKSLHWDIKWFQGMCDEYLEHENIYTRQNCI